jgi:hypothetical protein
MSTTRGKTPVLTGEQMRQSLEWVDTSELIGLGIELSSQSCARWPDLRFVIQHLGESWRWLNCLGLVVQN